MNPDELENKDFIAEYILYTSGTEVPTFFNRWACVVGLGAWAMQDVWVETGFGRIFPNLYAMLVGTPGSRKSTAIKDMRNLLREVGYSYFAGEKTSKEMFLSDLSKISRSNFDPSERVDEILFGSNAADSEVVTPCFIAADEFGDFFGNNVMEFIATLGVLWDARGLYKYRVKSGPSVEISNPNISILGGNTVETLCRTFPPEALGQGFFSRLLFIYGEANGRKIAFPELKSEEEREVLRQKLLKMKQCMSGEMKLSEPVSKALTTIYNKFKGLHDTRFSYYGTRRFTQLIKLTMIHALADYSHEIKLTHVIRANTLLTHTEHHMPRALGEFGRAKNSVIIHRLMQIIESRYKPIDFVELWKEVQGDMDKVSELGEAIKSLMMSGKIQAVEGGFLPVKAVQIEENSDLYDWNYLTDEERNIR